MIGPITPCRSTALRPARWSLKYGRAAPVTASSAQRQATELYTEKLLPNVAAGANLSSRDVPNYDMMIEVKVSFDTDRDRAWMIPATGRRWALSPGRKMSVEDPLQMERLADALPVERAASRWIVSTDPDEHVERIKFYYDLGFRHLVFHAPGPDQARFPRSIRRTYHSAVARPAGLSHRRQFFEQRQETPHVAYETGTHRAGRRADGGKR